MDTNQYCQKLKGLEKKHFMLFNKFINDLSFARDELEHIPKRNILGRDMKQTNLLLSRYIMNMRKIHKELYPK